MQTIWISGFAGAVVVSALMLTAQTSEEKPPMPNVNLIVQHFKIDALLAELERRRQ